MSENCKNKRAKHCLISYAPAHLDLSDTFSEVLSEINDIASTKMFVISLFHFVVNYSVNC